MSVNVEVTINVKATANVEVTVNVNSTAKVFSAPNKLNGAVGKSQPVFLSYPEPDLFSLATSFGFY